MSSSLDGFLGDGTLQIVYQSTYGGTYIQCVDIGSPIVTTGITTNLKTAPSQTIPIAVGVSAAFAGATLIYRSKRKSSQKSLKRKSSRMLKSQSVLKVASWKGKP